MKPLARHLHRLLGWFAPAGRAAWGDRLRVLAYHGVPDRARFEQQVDHLSSHYRPVPLAEAVSALRGEGATLPRRAVLVTFDDGDRTVLEHAMPVLAERGVPAVAFVVAGLIGTHEPFWWEEVDEREVARLKLVPDDERRRAVATARAARASTGPAPLARHHLTEADLRTLAANGVEVGNHSLTHPCLDRCDGATIEREVRESHARLRDMLAGEAPSAFAYPNGNEDARVARSVAAAGYRVAFLFDHRLSPVPAPDPFRVSRIRVNADDPLDRFAARVSGVHPFVHAVRQ